ncbi:MULTISPECIES: aromatic amino acid hydroxylase [Sphingobacterium]|uniref:aromatic amino acid hydroxylase n=1 Tax=Sphingobacterium TaxID=28453 RepID=UPI00104319CD|nr:MULTISPECIES: aromatic amino acid hydroxylase [Sphingobacterium]MCW2262977.1 phenylalanine-4-hydroxylase [Sphingobacterium kitahiroshimense]TCR12032.1 phenylalanine-4-hydroxylase [Sphingobacterium sp. JUb78]
METYGNPVLNRLPQHLKRFIVPQQYDRYTAIDQAVWRYVMRQNYAYLRNIAYYPYIPGLHKAGLTIEEIPNLQTMNDSLKHMGWGAATVDGFIPPAAFMEFQAYRVLVVAADIRQIEHIEYTPAPDIIHESSGHAPIIGEPEYAAYLQYFGEIGTKAMFSEKDFELYEAIRNLSILKESSSATEEQLSSAEAKLIAIQENMGEPSEMALLSRLHWWTVEYGLIGTVDDPKIYGAGLLSSIGESASCMRKEVPKLPYSLNALAYSYDITKPQPQLFVTEDFNQLREVLDQFANTMSFRVGGKVGLEKAIACKNLCTIVYSSGLQVSGLFQTGIAGSEIEYIKTVGPTALAYADRQLSGHGKTYHADGFGSPVGYLLGAVKALEDFDAADLKEYGIEIGQHTTLIFTSGIEVRGVVQSIEQRDKKNQLITFSPCQVVDSRSCQILFDPEWGTYDMAVGKQIVSVFCGAADKEAYEQGAFVSETKTIVHQQNEVEKSKNKLYKVIRDRRTGQEPDVSLSEIYQNITHNYPEDWLAYIETLELAIHDGDHLLATQIENRLLEIIQDHQHWSKLILDGINLAKNDQIALLLGPK